MTTTAIELELQALPAVAVPIYRYRLKNPEALNRMLDEAVYEERSKDPRGVNYQGESTYHTRDGLHTDPRFAALLAVFDAAIEDRWRAVRWTAASHPWRAGALWANIAEPGNLTHEHVHWGHAGTVFGGVYYSKVPPGSGSLRARSFDLYCASIGDVELTDYEPFDVAHWIEIEPQPGELLLFPNWVWHSVTPNRSTSDRIAWTALFQISGPILPQRHHGWRTTDAHPRWQGLLAND